MGNLGGFCAGVGSAGGVWESRKVQISPLRTYGANLGLGDPKGVITQKPFFQLSYIMQSIALIYISE
jgi:hypothetical protein